MLDLFGLKLINKKGLINLIDFHRSQERSKILESLPPAFGNQNIPKDAVNPNICDRCMEPNVCYGFYDTGICGKCGSCGECQDPELVALYTGMGLDGEYVSRHLPRLRCSWSENSKAPMSLKDIGIEIARHTVFGVCDKDWIACQGFGIEKRSTMVFEEKTKRDGK